MSATRLEFATHAGTAFDGRHLFQIAENRIQKIDPQTGRVLATIPVLVFTVDPEPLVLPVDIRAHYIGERWSAAETWERLTGRANSS